MQTLSAELILFLSLRATTKQSRELGQVKGRTQKKNTITLHSTGNNPENPRQTLELKPKEGHTQIN